MMINIKLKSKQIRQYVQSVDKQIMSSLPINIKQLDQSTWSCYQLQNHSYYYGEVGYLDQSGIVHPKDNNQAATNPKNKLVKHGFGVYFFNINPQTQTPQQKYIGQWDKDQKSGKGQFVESNGTVYEGNFHEGHYHGSGKLTWPSGDSYDGMWKRSKMDGSGVFKQSSSGLTLKGLFKNNYFIDDNILRNPFLSQKEYSVYKKQRKQIMRQKEKQQKIKHGYVKKVEDNGELRECIEKSVGNNRVAMILSTKASQYSLKSVSYDLQSTYGKQQKINIMDLRKLYLLQGQQKQNYRQEVHEAFRQSLVKGEIFLISMDDSEMEFPEMFYPDLKEFYDSNGFNQLAWDRVQLTKKQVRAKIINGEEVNQQFKLILWTKYKVEQQQLQDRIANQVAIRFQKILPIVKIDYLIITKQSQIHS